MMSLSFQPNLLSLLVGGLAVLFAAWLCWRGYRRNPRKLTFALESLRFVIILILCVLLQQPEWVELSQPKDNPQITILWDASESMKTEDIKQSGSLTSREAEVKRLLDSKFWLPLEQQSTIHLASFSEMPKEDDPEAMLAGTDVGKPLDACLESSDNLRAVIVLSDGDHNQGIAPQAAAQRLRLRGVPIFSIPVGEQEPLPDLSLAELKAPTYGIIGETVQVPFTVKSTLGRESAITVVLRSKTSGREKQLQLKVPAQGEVSAAILWKIEGEGTDNLELHFPPLVEELIKDNNKASFTLSGRKESIKVLVIDSQPRWEYRFIRNALYRDPGVEVHTLLMHPGIGEIGEGPGYITKFPDRLEDLAQYDVIFLGDVGMGPKGLTEAQADLLKGLVQNRASGIVFLPGVLGKQNELLKSSLADLMPVTLDPSKPKGTSLSVASPLLLTSQGRTSLLTLLGDSEKQNEEIWRGLPGFNWFAPVERVKAGALVLAVHSSQKNQYGSIPLLVTQSYGNGKVLYMGTDAAWRWRRGVEDKYHYRFWGQVARWMSYQRSMAAGEHIRLLPNPERPNLGDNVNINALVSDSQGAPLTSGEVFLDVVAPDGKSSHLQLAALSQNWGSYTANFKITRSGRWKIKGYTSIDPEKFVELVLDTRLEKLEKVGRPACPDLLAELSEITGGRLVSTSDIESLVKEVRTLPTPRPMEKRLLLWCHPYVLFGLLFLLSLFWVGRKLNGTI